MNAAELRQMIKDVIDGNSELTDREVVNIVMGWCEGACVSRLQVESLVWEVRISK
jgi:hypothetical protein